MTQFQIDVARMIALLFGPAVVGSVVLGVVLVLFTFIGRHD